MTRRYCCLFLALVVLLPLVFLAPAGQAATTVYNKYNIHTYDNGRDIRASYANWTDPGKGHGIIPPDTPMTIENWRNGFIIHTQNKPKKKIYFIYDEGRMRMPVSVYIQQITAPAPIALEGLAPLDLEGVKAGKAMVGMSKDGVLAALGYPAQHRTPTLQSNEWTYWKNRFTTLVVVFDNNGIVTAIRE